MRVFGVVAAIIFYATCAFSQTSILRDGKTFVFDTTFQSLVVDIRGGANVHLATDLRCLDDARCKPFQGGTGTMFGLGLGFEQKISRTFWWSGMLGVDVWGNQQKVRDDSARVRDANNNVVPLVRELQLETSGVTLDLSGGIQYQHDGWRLWLMPSLLLNAGAPTWRQTATIIAPSDILYPNGSRTDETVPETEMADASTLRIGGKLGVGRDIPVTSLGTLTPSLQIAYSPMSIRPGNAWTDLRGTLGLSLRINVDNLPDTVQERRTLYLGDTMIVRRIGTRDTDYVIAGLTRIEYDTIRDGYFRTITERQIRVDTLVQESKSNELTTIVGSTRGAQDILIWKRVSGRAKVDGPVTIDTLNVSKLDSSCVLSKLDFQLDLNESESIFMVLPAIFFEAGSAELASRYKRLAPTETDSYREFSNAQTQAGAYHDVLNILGSRLRKGTESITLNGYIDSATDGNNCSLALQRALSVRSYLVSVWGIDSTRISIQWNVSSCQPELVSTSVSSKGQQENRRVDITSSTITPYLPVVRVDRTTKLQPSIPMLQSDVLSMSNTSIVEWRYDFTQNSKLLWSRSGSGTLQSIEFTPPPEAMESTSKSSSVTVVFTLITQTDGSQDTMQTALSIPLVSNIVDQKFKRLSLATFGIRSSTLSERDQQLLERFVSRLDPGDKVVINGYSDDLGEPESNLKLSQRRADVVAEAARTLRPDVKILSIRGVGSREYPLGITSYDNPEERFLSRVVQLSIVE